MLELDAIGMEAMAPTSLIRSVGSVERLNQFVNGATPASYRGLNRMAGVGWRRLANSPANRVISGDTRIENFGWSS